jgi:hypothetical protein
MPSIRPAPKKHNNIYDGYSMPYDESGIGRWPVICNTMWSSMLPLYKKLGSKWQST